MLSHMLKDFDDNPRSHDFALELSKHIIKGANQSVLLNCLIELAKELDKDNLQISNLSYSENISSPLRDLLYMTIQVVRGQGELDGEGLSNYSSRALSLGWTEEEVTRLVLDLDKQEFREN